MIENLIAWILRAVSFGTIIMYGCMGETITEKSGKFDLGVPVLCTSVALRGLRAHIIMRN